MLFLAGALAANLAPKFGTIGKEPEPEPEEPEQAPEEPAALPDAAEGVPEEAEEAEDMEGTGDGPVPAEEDDIEMGSGSGVFGSIEEPSDVWEPQWPESFPMGDIGGQEDTAFVDQLHGEMDSNETLFPPMGDQENVTGIFAVYFTFGCC